MELMEEIDNSTKIVENFNTILSIVDKTTGQKIAEL
jgi:hypothetical protein